MNAHDAYKRANNGAPRRIDLVLMLFRTALAKLEEARPALAANRHDVAGPLLARTQLIVSALASGHAGCTDSAALNFLRLYEFVAYRLSLGTVADVDASARILRTLLDGFEVVRDQAVALEAHGAIPPLDRERIVQVIS